MKIYFADPHALIDSVRESVVNDTQPAPESLESILSEWQLRSIIKEFERAADNRRPGCDCVVSANAVVVALAHFAALAKGSGL